LAQAALIAAAMAALALRRAWNGLLERRIICADRLKALRMPSLHFPDLQPRSRSVLLILLTLLLTGCAGRALMPTPNLYSAGGGEPFAETPPAWRSTRVDLLYATDRVPETDSTGRLVYGHGRSRSLAFGSAMVEIGDGSNWAALDADSRRRKRGQAWPLRMGSLRELGRFVETPYPFTVQDGRIVANAAVLAEQAGAEDALRREVARRLSAAPTKELLIYVHGYNNGFDDAALTLAELWHFTGRTGVPLLYTWPAGHGGLSGYAYDRESGEFTIFHLKQLLRALAELPELEGIHLLSHSRGTDVAVSAERELVIEARAAGVDPRARYRIANLILAAPDIDVDVLGQRVIAERIGEGTEQVTIYASRKDKAIGLAEALFGSALRLGRASAGRLPATVASRFEDAGNVAMVESRSAGGLIGHGYFHSDPATSSDLILVLRDRRPPGAAHGRPLTPVDVNIWALDEGYPGRTAGRRP
jgi:esterase/lipase superfamily enzyme